jgi:hypothetical protein
VRGDGVQGGQAVVCGGVKVAADAAPAGEGTRVHRLVEPGVGSPDTNPDHAQPQSKDQAAHAACRITPHPEDA